MRMLFAEEGRALFRGLEADHCIFLYALMETLLQDHVLTVPGKTECAEVWLNLLVSGDAGSCQPLPWRRPDPPPH